MSYHHLTISERIRIEIFSIKHLQQIEEKNLDVTKK